MSLKKLESFEIQKESLDVETKGVVKRIVDDALAKAARDARLDAETRVSDQVTRRRSEKDSVRTRYRGD